MQEILTKVGVAILEMEPKLKEAQSRAEASTSEQLRFYNQGKAEQLILILHELRRLYASIEAKI